MARIRRPLAMLVLLLAALAADAALAAPRRLTEDVRTALCCVRDCGQLRGVACVLTCCAPRGEPGRATVSTAPREETPATVPAALPPPRRAEAPAPVAGCGVPLASRGNDPPPVFLLNRTLRL